MREWGKCRRLSELQRTLHHVSVYSFCTLSFPSSKLCTQILSVCVSSIGRRHPERIRKNTNIRLPALFSDKQSQDAYLLAWQPSSSSASTPTMPRARQCHRHASQACQSVHSSATPRAASALIPAISRFRQETQHQQSGVLQASG